MGRSDERIDMRDVYEILVVEPVRRINRRWEDNIKVKVEVVPVL
jgi:hypothetical protein